VEEWEKRSRLETTATAAAIMSSFLLPEIRLPTLNPHFQPSPAGDWVTTSSSPQPLKEARRTRHVSRPLILFLRDGNTAFR
jgi:hypothetical protein